MNDPNEYAIVDLEAHMVRLGNIRKKKHARKRRGRWPRRRRRF